jgi:glycosyltransferase involved in cell wall biosynthesis
MKVAFLSYDHPEYCIRLASALAGDNDVLLLLPGELAEGHLARLHPDVHYVPFHKPRLREPLAQLRTAWDLARSVRRFDPDVLHVQQGHMWFNLALPLLSRYPLVVTVHDAQHHVGDRNSQRTPQAIMDLAYRQADELIVHASQLADLLERRLHVDPAEVHVIPHVVLGQDGAGPAAGEEEGLVLFFGRIWPYKGLDYLIRAEPAITAQVPDARFMIAGAGEDLARYRQMMQHPDRFVVLNYEVPDETRAELFARASVVVLPYIEASQSGVIPVAYNAGKPVVATAVGGLPAMVEDGRTGYLVPPCDESELAQAVVRLLRDPDLRHEMGRNAKRKVQSECSPEVIAVQLLDVYRQATRKRKKSGSHRAIA